MLRNYPEHARLILSDRKGTRQMGISHYRTGHTHVEHGNVHKNRQKHRRSHPIPPTLRAMIMPEAYTVYCNHHDSPCPTRAEHKARVDASRERNELKEQRLRQSKEPKELDPRHFCNHTPFCESPEAHRSLKKQAEASLERRLKEARQRLFGA